MSRFRTSWVIWEGLTRQTPHGHHSCYSSCSTSKTLPTFHSWTSGRRAGARSHLRLRSSLCIGTLFSGLFVVSVRACTGSYLITGMSSLLVFEAIRLLVNWPFKLQIMLGNITGNRTTATDDLCINPIFLVSGSCLVSTWTLNVGLNGKENTLRTCDPILPEVLATANRRKHSTMQMKRIRE